MKNCIMTATTLVLFGTIAVADADPRYADPAVVIAELRELVETCRSIPVHTVQPEIFGLETRRVDDHTCLIGHGEVDDNVVKFFQQHPLDWAGLDGDDGIWVRLTD